MSCSEALFCLLKHYGQRRSRQSKDAPQAPKQKATSMPRVSIITPLHNKGQFITQTIRSVISQITPDWEMIVVENGSTDDGPEQAATIVREEPRVRLLHAPASVRGPGAARNHGLDHASGDWILFLDADDLIVPEYLADALEVALANPQANLIVGGWREFTTNPQEASYDHIPVTYGCPRDMVLARAVACVQWAPNAALIAEKLARNNRWPEQFDPFADEDTPFWFAILTEATPAWHRGCGALYRNLSHGTRSTTGTLMERIHCHTRIFEHNLALAETRNIRLPLAAACSISMIYEVYYRNAIASGDLSARDLTLRLATRWLRDCDCKSWNTRLRKLIGIRAVNFLRNIVRREKPRGLGGR